MSAPESLPTLHDLIGEADIHELIEDRLMESGYPRGFSEKYFVDGHPDILVRTETHFAPGLWEEAIRAANATHRLPHFGVKTVPNHPVHHNGTIYVVTQKVTGTPLDPVESVLTPQTPPHVLEQVDRQWAGLSHYLLSDMVLGKEAAMDIYAPHQHMYGFTATDPIPDVRLVDPAFATINLWRFPQYYAEDLMGQASYINALEAALDRPLTLARTALRHAIDLAIDRNGEVDFYIEKAEELIRSHEVVDVTEDDRFSYYQEEF